MTKFLTATAVAAALATSAFAADKHMIEKVDVSFELDAVKSEVAAQFWADLEGDLEEAIVTRVADQLGESGSVITVDVDELDMATNFQSTLDVDSSLAASIMIKNEDDPTKDSFYDLKVIAHETGAFVKTDEGYKMIATERERVYDLMVEAFADGLVRRLR